MKADQITTVVIANWRRPENVESIARLIPAPHKLFILDNSNGACPLSDVVRQRCDWLLTSTRNNLFSRWYLASQADTARVVIHDDDLWIDDWRPFEAGLPTETPSLLGPWGVKLLPGLGYYRSQQLRTTGEAADIIKGRFVYAAATTLRQLPMVGLDTHEHIAEDIFASLHLKARGGIHRIVHPQITELPAPFASSGTREHYVIRARVTARLRALYRFAD